MKPDQQIPGTPGELDAINLIHKERKRQKLEELWTDEHDDKHTDGSLWAAARFYASFATKTPEEHLDFQQWPWEWEWFKPWKKGENGEYLITQVDTERCLVKAGALIFAEQERLERELEKVVGKLSELQTRKEQSK